MDLTKAEEQVMLILWEIEQGFVKEILQHFPDPKPAYNTVSTIIRILEKKGFVAHREFGKAHQYYPTIKKEHYSKSQLSSLVKGYFDDSIKKVLSQFSSTRKIKKSEADELIQMLEELKKSDDHA